MSRGRPQGGLFCFSGGLSQGQLMAGLAVLSRKRIFKAMAKILTP
jgi:hypothetical protein